ncbi:hypothetical protein HF1_14970 [Mycoplasma haemofelis str. Langford 1]|uniref:Uncharacterized protein n=2 Tax=Mycoplasma haemofelis TaxID=29501 RepID=F6FHG8_MYCHI|nr:hypothetical protein [Mycoplasma haemofelis]AEG73798.1 hypothetical protein MHF_1566 [Mycoplasma haemofelis Ohio2]CBY93505.1 hypothetical protein HF1_14970 [Mycoplasma haemofelis str. Langford 1]
MRRSIRGEMSYCFGKSKFKGGNLSSLIFGEYEDEILILASFIFISSSFMCKRKGERNFDFDWKSYFDIFSSKHNNSFILCAIRYLLDKNEIVNNRELITRACSDLKDNFHDQYLYSIVYRKAKELNQDIDLDKYLTLLDIVLKINRIYKKEVPKDSSKVMELVDNTWDWKNKVFEMFGNKSEYVIFSFFVNLNS